MATNIPPRVTFTSMPSGVSTMLVRRFDLYIIYLTETTAGRYGSDLVSAIEGDNLCLQGGIKIKSLRPVSD